MTVIVLSPEMVEQIVEDFARFMMAKHVEPNDWGNFARNTSFRIMKLANEKTSSSGSYRIKYEDPSKRETVPAPPLTDSSASSTGDPPTGPGGDRGGGRYGR